MTYQRADYCMHRSARKGGPHPPVRSLKEFAAEFGQPVARLCGLLSMYPGPKPTLRTSTRAGGEHTGASYYLIEPMRQWWRSLPPQGKPPCE